MSAVGFFKKPWWIMLFWLNSLIGLRQGQLRHNRLPRRQKLSQHNLDKGRKNSHLARILMHRLCCSCKHTMPVEITSTCSFAMPFFFFYPCQYASIGFRLIGIFFFHIWGRAFWGTLYYSRQLFTKCDVVIILGYLFLMCLFNMEIWTHHNVIRSCWYYVSSISVQYRHTH